MTVGTRLSHCFLGSGQFGRSNDLHGFRNLLDVANGFEAPFDFAQGCISGGWCCDGPGEDVSTLRGFRDQWPIVSSHAGYVEAKRTYRAVTGTPTRKAGRATLDNMTSYNTCWRGEWGVKTSRNQWQRLRFCSFAMFSELKANVIRTMAAHVILTFVTIS